MADPIRVLESTYVTLPESDIDTDQIIPARFLTTTSREGLGEHLFHDVRGRGQLAHALFDERARGASVLVAGENFGCGSSREHAPWALLDHGFRAVVAPSFADIFVGNALNNGLLPVTVPGATYASMIDHPFGRVSIDLEAQLVRSSAWSGPVSFALEPFARYRLLRGLDPLSFLLSQDEAITAFEEARR